VVSSLRIRELADRVLDHLPHARDGIVFTGPEEGRRIAFTFDDGPSAANTPELLDLLARHGARATFFVVGNHVKGSEPLLRRIVDEGHELGNHSYSHPHTLLLSRSEIVDELSATNDALAQVGTTPRWARPPFGKDRRRFTGAACELGLVSVMWSIDSGDTRGRGRDEIVEYVLQEVAPGAILLFHDGGDRRPLTLSAVEALLPELTRRGYELTTLVEAVVPPKPATPPASAKAP
jgi:peptidoglycan/xylan/chitin deacetylase (PgdA/CDA1 family)